MRAPRVFAAAVLAVAAAAAPDWLVDPVTTPVTWTPAPATQAWTLSNGLVSRTFATAPGFGCVGFDSLSAGRSLLRALSPEAIVTLDDARYEVGDLRDTLPFHGYWNASALAAPGALTRNASAWRFVGFNVSSPVAPYPWTPGTRFAPADVAWPPAGLTVALHFAAPASAPPAHQAVSITVVYEMYVGVPAVSKWVVVESAGAAAAGVRVSATVVEVLRPAHPYAATAWSPGSPWWLPSQPLPPQLSHLVVLADEPHGALVTWSDDHPTVDVDTGASEVLLTTNYSSGPGVYLGGGSRASAAAFAAARGRTAPWTPPMHATGLGAAVAEFVSFRTLELVTDTEDRERSGLSVRRLWRLLAPQIQESPIFFHGTAADSAGMRAAVDQMADVGFEMFIYSFGTSFDFEAPGAPAKFAADIAYARGRGIEVGGYDLICLQRGNGGYGGNVGAQWDTVAPDGTTLGVDACFASGWVDALAAFTDAFVAVNLTMFETDGPYGGEPCASENHTYHLGADDAVYQQNRVQGAFYARLRAGGMFINQPDGYFAQGGNKAPLGYNEGQYSLPRAQDLTLSRIGMFEDTFTMVPTQGWMFVPLVDYHGGGDAAAFEPLATNLVDYNFALAQYFGYGVAACYRGPRLYDPAAPATRAVVQYWVAWFKRYRDIVTADIVHVARPDGARVDAILHVDPQRAHRGMAVFFNPTDVPVTVNVSLPLYYTGIATAATLTWQDAPAPVRVALARDYSVVVSVTVGARNATWALVASAD